MVKALFFAVVSFGACYFAQASLTTLDRRDSSAFLDTLPTLKAAAATFAGDQFRGSGNPDIHTLDPVATAQLTKISNDLKNLSDVFDNSYIQLAELDLFNPNGFQLSPSDAATVNNTIPGIQATILSQLIDLSDLGSLFEDVNNNPNWLDTMCHRAQILSTEHEDLLRLLSSVTPSRGYSSFWSSLATTAAQQYGYAILSSESGFNC